MKILVFLLIAGLLPSIAFGQFRTSVVQYKDGDTALEGYSASKVSESGKGPGVLVVPDWLGLSEHYRKIADKLSELGYVAFVADIYGKEVRPKDSNAAAAEANKYKSDRALMRHRKHFSSPQSDNRATNCR